MLNTLAEVARKVDAVIAGDDFPQKIEPGFLRDAVTDYPKRGGKRLRPALVLWCCGLLGGCEGKALLPAAACEVFHNWTLVHDDIIDDDDFRRGVPTCHRQLEKTGAAEFGLDRVASRRFGRNFAILCGDLQQAWANSLLLRSASSGLDAALVNSLALRLQDFANRLLVSGEALDVAMSFRDASGVNPGEVARMFELKTGVLFQFCAETGAAIALGRADFDHPQVLAAGKMAMNAAVAFQLRDDCLGIFGETGKFGKPIGSDLSERKATMLLLDSLAALPEAGRAELLSLLGKPEYEDAEIERVRRIYTESGALARTQARAAGLAAEARRNLALLPDNRYRRLLEDLLDYLLEREV